MMRFHTEPEPKPRSDISRAQVARFIRRMAVVSEGDTRLVRVIEDADSSGPAMTHTEHHDVLSEFLVAMNGGNPLHTGFQDLMDGLALDFANELLRNSKTRSVGELRNVGCKPDSTDIYG